MDRMYRIYIIEAKKRARAAGASSALQRVDPTVPARGLERWFPNISLTLKGHASTNHVTDSLQTRPQGEPPPEVAGQVNGDRAEG